MPPSCPTNVSRRTGRAPGPLPQLASSAVPEAEAPLPADPHASPSGEQTCHPEIRVRRDAPVVCPCRFVDDDPDLNGALDIPQKSPMAIVPRKPKQVR